MVNTVTLLTYLMTHAFGHRDRLQLGVQHTKKAVVLKWKDVPPEAHSLAVVIKDLSKKKPHYYGVVYNLPPESHGIKLDHHIHVSNRHWGKNSWGQVQAHRQLLSPKKPLLVSLYALDKKFSSGGDVTGQKIEQGLKGHVIAKARRHLWS